MNAIDQRPGNFSFKRGVDVSDAPLYNMHKGAIKSPVRVLRTGQLGAQNQDVKGNEEVANPLLMETAKTDVDADGIAATFSVSIHPLTDLLYACAGANQEAMRQSVDDFLARCRDSAAVSHVARRFARNIANARFMHRNRSLGQTIQVDVTRGDETLSFDAKGISLYAFENYSDDEQTLGQWIEEALVDGQPAPLQVTAKVFFGAAGSREVYPTQNYLSKKPDGLSRSLYKLGGGAHQNQSGQDYVGDAALRDTKIWNAIRTIDDWYPDYDDYGMPIPVEPLGASIKLNTFFRRESDPSNNAYGLMKNLPTLEPESDKGLFMLAALIRGGVYGENKSGKKKGE